MRESPLIILWLDNLGVFYPLIGELGTSLLAIGPPDPGAGIVYGRQLACGSISHLYNSLCRILYGRPPGLLQPEADLLFGTQ